MTLQEQNKHLIDIEENVESSYSAKLVYIPSAWLVLTPNPLPSKIFLLLCILFVLLYERMKVMALEQQRDINERFTNSDAEFMETNWYSKGVTILAWCAFVSFVVGSIFMIL